MEGMIDDAITTIGLPGSDSDRGIGRITFGQASGALENGGDRRVNRWGGLTDGAG
jgi:hypothetical protein